MTVPLAIASAQSSVPVAPLDSWESSFPRFQKGFQVGVRLGAVRLRWVERQVEQGASAAVIRVGRDLPGFLVVGKGVFVVKIAGAHAEV